LSVLTPAEDGTTRIWRHRKKDGTVIDVEITGHQLRFDGHRARIVEVSDITERKRTEDLLWKQQALLKSIIAHIPYSVFWKDRNCVMLGCNENVARDAGVKSPEDLIGKTDYEMPWTKEQADFFVQCDREVMDSG